MALCNHEQFISMTRIARLADENQPLRFQADITINCQQCGEAFAFLGLPGGMSLFGAACSFDRTEARLAICPVSDTEPLNRETIHLGD
jgi:hypothetical protein